MMARTMAHTVGVVAITVLLLTASFANAKPEPTTHTDTARRFTLSYSAAFRPSKAPVGSEAILYLQNGALRASVSTFKSANRAAFRKDRNDSFFDSIERGIASGAKRYKRKLRKSQRIDRVPTLDLSFSRISATGAVETVWMRFLFRYRFTVVATAILPASSKRRLQREARNFTQSLDPLARQ
jgi:hypothetical protein